jgi:hypothetical protein
MSQCSKFAPAMVWPYRSTLGRLQSKPQQELFSQGSPTSSLFDGLHWPDAIPANYGELTSDAAHSQTGDGIPG